jgi:hypothetical protein
MTGERSEGDIRVKISPHPCRRPGETRPLSPGPLYPLPCCRGSGGRAVEILTQKRAYRFHWNCEARQKELEKLLEERVRINTERIAKGHKPIKYKRIVIIAHEGGKENLPGGNFKSGERFDKDSVKNTRIPKLLQELLEKDGYLLLGTCQYEKEKKDRGVDWAKESRQLAEVLGVAVGVWNVKVSPDLQKGAKPMEFEVGDPRHDPYYYPTTPRFQIFLPWWRYVVVL